MLVAVRTIGMATPKTVLTELVVVALLASVPETHHALTPAIRTFHGMEDLVEMRKEGKKNKKKNFKKISTIRFHWNSKKHNTTPRFLITKPISYANQVMDSETRGDYFGTINHKSKLMIIYQYHLVHSVFLLQLSPSLDMLRPGKFHASSTT